MEEEGGKGEDGEGERDIIPYWHFPTLPVLVIKDVYSTVDG